MHVIVNNHGRYRLMGRERQSLSYDWVETPSEATKYPTAAEAHLVMRLRGIKGTVVSL